MPPSPRTTTADDSAKTPHVPNGEEDGPAGDISRNQRGLLDQEDAAVDSTNRAGQPLDQSSASSALSSSTLNVGALASRIMKASPMSSAPSASEDTDEDGGIG
ncbi:unnamed protein product, partial [Amoebophrya sp. A25]|eukprot:GSA25T00014507001.1